MNSDLIELLAAFGKNTVRYLIIDGYAVGFHVEPRYTKDCDFWIATDAENAEAVHVTLKQFGAPLYGTAPKDFQGDNEFFFFGQPPNRIDIIMGPPGNLKFEDAWKRRVVQTVNDVPVIYASREDLIALKETSGREIDKRDVEALKKSQRP